MTRRTAHNKRKAFKEQNVLVVLVEGTTEENYLRFLKSMLNKPLTLKVEMKSKLGSDIRVFVEKYARKHSIDPQELVLIYDLENSAQEKKKFINGTQLHHKNTFLTQPCMEVHFLLHHGQKMSANRFMTPDEVLERLLKFSPNYIKGSHYSWGKEININHIETAKLESIRAFTSFDNASFSMIGHFINDFLIDKTS